MSSLPVVLPTPALAFWFYSQVHLAVARTCLVNKQPIFQASQAREHFLAAAGAKLGHSTSHVAMLCGRTLGRDNRAEEEQIVKIRQWKHSHLTKSTDRNFTAKQEALLSALILDRRNNAWARELLRRRNGVARWRGQSGCSVREIIEALDALPNRCYAVSERALATDPLVELEAA